MTLQITDRIRKEWSTILDKPMPYWMRWPSAFTNINIYFRAVEPKDAEAETSKYALNPTMIFKDFKKWQGVEL